MSTWHQHLFFTHITKNNLLFGLREEKSENKLNILFSYFYSIYYGGYSVTCRAHEIRYIYIYVVIANILIENNIPGHC